MARSRVPGEARKQAAGVAISAGPDLTGWNQGRAETLQQLLVEELAPKDAIERLWLSDIAHLTARLEHMRLMQRGYYLQLLHSRLDSILGHSLSDFNQDELEILEAMAERDFNFADDANPEDLDLYGRFLSVAIAPNLERIKRLDDLEKGLLWDRDRVFAQFEKRRRSQIIDAVEVLEQSFPALPAPGE